MRPPADRASTDDYAQGSDKDIPESKLAALHFLGLPPYLAIQVEDYLQRGPATADGKGGKNGQWAGLETHTGPNAQIS